MKLRLDEYYYILNRDYELEEIEEYMPEDMAEEFEKFRESHTRDEICNYLDNLYSHIEIINTQYHTNYFDLEK